MSNPEIFQRQKSIAPDILKPIVRGDELVSVRTVLILASPDDNLIELYPAQKFTSDWKRQGKCVADRTDATFEQRFASKITKEAQRTCIDCPVLLECLNFGLSGGPEGKRILDGGIYAGLTQRQRDIWANRAADNIVALQAGINAARAKTATK